MAVTATRGSPPHSPPRCPGTTPDALADSLSGSSSSRTSFPRSRHATAALACVRDPSSPSSTSCIPACGPASCARPVPPRPAEPYRRREAHDPPSPPDSGRWGMRSPWAAALDHRHIRIHHHVLGVGRPHDRLAPCCMVEVRMADQEDLHVAQPHPELRQTRLDQRHRLSRLLLIRMSPSGVFTR